MLAVTSYTQLGQILFNSDEFCEMFAIGMCTEPQRMNEKVREKEEKKGREKRKRVRKRVREREREI